MIEGTLYAKYIKERRGLDVLESEHGFLTYKMNGEECFIADMCIEEDRRTAGHGRVLTSALEALAKDAGCKYISANIDLNAGGANNCLLAAMTVGFEVRAANLNVLLIVKDLGA